MNIFQRLLNRFVAKDIVADDPYDTEDLYSTDRPCVVGKDYFTHLRKWDWRDGDIELCNHGGATLCWRVERGSTEDATVYWLVYTWAQCTSKKDKNTGRYDQFCRKTGREICLENFKSHPTKLFYEARTTLPTVNHTRDYVIDEYKAFKSKYDSTVWEDYQ